MRDLIMVEEKNNKPEFVVKLSSDIARALKIYCETIEMPSLISFRTRLLYKSLYISDEYAQEEMRVFLGFDVRPRLLLCLTGGVNNSYGNLKNLDT